jgi:hypothetical protein
MSIATTRTSARRRARGTNAKSRRRAAHVAATPSRVRGEASRHAGASPRSSGTIAPLPATAAIARASSTVAAGP